MHTAAASNNRGHSRNYCVACQLEGSNFLHERRGCEWKAVPQLSWMEVDARGYWICPGCARFVNRDVKREYRAMLVTGIQSILWHSADLDQEGCFDEIFKSCNGVCHVSHVSDYNDQDYVARTCANVINSINKSESVTRVIVTSSIAAVISEMDLQELVRRPVFYEDRYPDEQNPKRTPEKGQGYSMGKIVAQRAFADAAVESGTWEAITCRPADNVGPILSAHQKDYGPWQHNIEMMLLGKYYQNGVYRPWMTVDVRDDAECHIQASAKKSGKLSDVHIIHRLQ